MAQISSEEFGSVEQREKDLVIGYNREFRGSKLHPVASYIPNSISYLCISFYHEYDYFNQCGDGLSIDSKGDTVMCINANPGKKLFCPSNIAYGLIGIDTSNMTALSTIYSWTFEVIHRQELNKRVSFGLYDPKTGCKLFYHGYSIELVPGTYIRMEFNVAKKFVDFYVNDKHELCHKFMKYHKQTWYMATSFKEHKAMIKLIRFRKTYAF